MKKLFVLIVICVASIAGAAGVITPHFSDIITKDGPVIDVRAFAPVGTLANGIVDWTTYIQAAINAAKVYCEDATGFRRGAVVFFPRGEYKVTSSLNATTALQKSDNMKFRGVGNRASIITAVLGSPGPVVDFTGQSWPVIEDLGIESRSASSQATAVVLFAANPSNSTYSNRYPILERAFLYASSPNIVATLVAYNADLMSINNSYIANASGTDAINIGPHVPTTVTSPFQTYSTRHDGTEYYVNNSTIIGGQAARVWGGVTLNVSNSYLARIPPLGVDNAIVVFECDTTNGPSFIAHGFRAENQTTDNNISLLYAKGTTGEMYNIVIDGDTFLYDLDLDKPQGGYIRSNGNLKQVFLRVLSDFGDPYMFNVAGSIYGTVSGHSNHSALGTVVGKIRGWLFTSNVNSETTMIQSLNGKIDGSRVGVNNGILFMSNNDGSAIIKVRWNASDNTLIYEAP